MVNLNRFGKLAIGSYAGLGLAALGFFTWASGVSSDLSWQASTWLVNACFASFIAGVCLSVVFGAIALFIPSKGAKGRLLAALPLVLAVIASAAAWSILTHLGIS